MAFEQFGPYITGIAAVDMTSNQYKAVVFDANGNLALATADASAVGVIVDKPLQGQTGTVQVYGVSRGVAGGSFNAGDLLASDANANFVKATAAKADTGTGAISGSEVIGRALETASASGEIVAVLLIHAGLTA